MKSLIYLMNNVNTEPDPENTDGGSTSPENGIQGEPTGPPPTPPR